MSVKIGDIQVYDNEAMEKLFVWRWKTVGLLYHIKDDYGKAMSWLHVMLKTWHLLKDYLSVFLELYLTLQLFDEGKRRLNRGLHSLGEKPQFYAVDDCLPIPPMSGRPTHSL